ncbi:hypothetical protein QJS10_CPA08g01328 [Acorus calamus]|uniref:Uncharacterized protein n=1 Tax=Acorus calamus TaxID=4465 RepID=A0AAV9ECV2_ACOCL|nr:hypothetical protein QJS10_CPA08g01328 [Acorus calamus]
MGGPPNLACKAFGLKNGKHKEGSFNITNSRSSSSNYYSDQPHLIPILNSWERRIHPLVYVDRIIMTVDPLVPPPAAQLSPDACPYLNKTFGLMIGMDNVQGVCVS